MVVDDFLHLISFSFHKKFLKKDQREIAEIVTRNEKDHQKEKKIATVIIVI